MALLVGYCCDEGANHNFGSLGAINERYPIRTVLAKMPNQLSENTLLFVSGNVPRPTMDIELAQNRLAKTVTLLLKAKAFPLVIGIYSF